MRVFESAIPTGKSHVSILPTHLGDGKEILGDVDNASHLLHALNTGLDSLGVVRPGAVEDVLDLLVVRLGPGLVPGTAVLDETAPDSEQAHGHD